MNSIIGKLNDGGPFFTYPILIFLLIILGLITYAFIQKTGRKKTVSLIASVGWFALAWGYMGRTFGLIMAFDKIAAAGEITPSLMAGGLKMALIDPLMGIVTFLVARLGIIILIWTGKNMEKEED